VPWVYAKLKWIIQESNQHREQDNIVVAIHRALCNVQTQIRLRCRLIHHRCRSIYKGVCCGAMIGSEAGSTSQTGEIFRGSMKLARTLSSLYLENIPEARHARLFHGPGMSEGHRVRGVLAASQESIAVSLHRPVHSRPPCGLEYPGCAKGSPRRKRNSYKILLQVKYKPVQDF